MTYKEWHLYINAGINNLIEGWSQKEIEGYLESVKDIPEEPWEDFKKIARKPVQLSEHSLAYPEIKKIPAKELKPGMKMFIEGYVFIVEGPVEHTTFGKTIFRVIHPQPGDYDEEDVRSYLHSQDLCVDSETIVTIKGTWLNGYAVIRQYGGPEEGGWFYSHYELVKAELVWAYEDSEQKRSLLEAELENKIDEFSSVYEPALIRVFEENTRGESQTLRRPIYW